MNSITRRTACALRLTQLLCIAGIISASNHALADDPFDKSVRPLLKKFCFSCHGPDEQNDDVRLDNLSTDLLTDRPAAETWHEVLHALNRGEMPPEDEPQPTVAERAVLTDWITAQIDRVVEARRTTGGRVVLRRLNRVEYANTMRDLLGVDLDFAKDLPPDGLSPDGFQNNGQSLGMTPLQLEYYLAAARSALSTAIVTSPEPPVFHETATKSAAGKRVKQAVANRLGRKSLFVLRMSDYPTVGRFRVRVNAHAELVEGKDVPQLRVAIGFRTDTVTPEKTLGVVDVTASSADEPQTLEFTGRIEHFPLPNKNRAQSKYPGLMVRVTNVFDDGSPAPKQKKPKKGESAPIDPTFPAIVINSIEFEGPLFESWPPKHHTNLIPPESHTDETSYAKSVLQRFMRRAFRRPVESSEVDGMLDYFARVRPDATTFEAAIRETLAMVLISPDFLYLVEPSADSKRPITDHEFASRLSYFLWSSMPDEQLMALAESGKLNEPEVLSSEIKRMLADERAWQFVEQFTNQWLDLGGVDRVAVNPEYYPKFDNALKADMQRETRLFFAEVLFKNLSAMNFIDSDFTVVNGRLAQHYGLAKAGQQDAPQGIAFQRISLPADSHRGGLLSHGSMLLATSTGEDSHPVKRGVWIRERLLDDPPAPPPPDVPDLNETNPDVAGLPIKKQLELHREKSACMNCHKGIDPWGITLDEFDAVGLIRTEVRRKKGRGFVKQPVDSQASLPGNYLVKGLVGLKQHLATRKRDQFARAMVVKLTTYALGRTLELTDSRDVDRMTAEFVKGDLRLQHLIGLICSSEPFRTK